MEGKEMQSRRRPRGRRSVRHHRPHHSELRHQRDNELEEVTIDRDDDLEEKADEWGEDRLPTGGSRGPYPCPCPYVARTMPIRWDEGCRTAG